MSERRNRAYFGLTRRPKPPSCVRCAGQLAVSAARGQAEGVACEDSALRGAYCVVKVGRLRREPEGTGTVDDGNVVAVVSGIAVEASQGRSPPAGNGCEGRVPVDDRPMGTLD
jgi:hypothetical protein